MRRSIRGGLGRDEVRWRLGRMARAGARLGLAPGLVLGLLLGLSLACGTARGAATETTVGTLQTGFARPPAAARPMVRWWWFGVAVTRREIARELRAMRADGIGGVELAFVYPLAVDDPARGVRNLRFLSPEMLGMVRYAQETARGMGLRVDVTLGSGWPFGGPEIPLELAAGRLRMVEIAVPAGAAVAMAARPPAMGDRLVAMSLVQGTAGAWSTERATSVELPKAGEGRVEFAPAPAERVLLCFYAGHTRQEVKRAAAGAEGYVLDPFRREAVAEHLRAVGEPMLRAFAGAPPYAVFSDSLEAYGADWTPGLPEEFARRRGYALLPHLPELVRGGTAEAKRVRHDYGVTLTELVEENYLEQINGWARAHGTRFRSQTYGEPAVRFSSERIAALPEGEGSQWRQFSTLRWASSANHVFGNRVTSGESFTWLHSPVFRATPLDMKAEADADFVSGENALIFHGWPYSPEDGSVAAGDPGWSLYAAAALNDHNPWHPVMPAVTRYLARMSFLLQQGEPANQVAVLLPTDDAWAGFAPGRVSVSQAMEGLITPELMDAILAGGYNVDFVDAAAVERVGLGTHTAVVVPATDRMPVETLRRLAEFGRAGGRVIAVQKRPSEDAEGAVLTGEGRREAEAMEVVGAARDLGEALHRAVAPDVRFADGEAAREMGFIRRKLGDADIYFVANTGNKTLRTTVGLRSRFAGGEEWDADTGRVGRRVEAAGVALDLAPYGSAVFVLHAGVGEGAAAWAGDGLVVADLSREWRVQFPGVGRAKTEPTLEDWAADPATEHYSGMAVYARDFVLDQVPEGRVRLCVRGGTAVAHAESGAEGATVLGADGLPDPRVTKTGPGMRAWFTPPVREAAEVRVNGQTVGTLWHPPYCLDVTRALRKGRNGIEVRVYNTALNAWAGAPPRDTSRLKKVYGDRFQMQDLGEVKPLPSGLLGGVELVRELGGGR